MSFLVLYNNVTPVPYQAHDNSIGLIPKEIGAVQNLLKLDLSRNGIEILPGEMFNLVRLTELRLGNNRVRELPGEIGNLINLTVLVCWKLGKS